ncbi:hypothetical protein DFJ74DRAFT_759938, partial [Hyaloraphidium curvatum]
MDPAAQSPENAAVAADPRTEALRERVFALLGLGPSDKDKWERMLANPTIRSDLASFLDSPDERAVLFWEANGADIASGLLRNMPKQTKQPVLYFFKPGRGVVDGPADVLALSFGRLNLHSVDAFYQLLQEICQPVFFDAGKASNLPMNVAHDLRRNMHSTMIASQYLLAESKGRTQLHLPSRVEDLAAAASSGSDPGEVLVLESTVAQWIKEIKAVFARTPEDI